MIKFHHAISKEKIVFTFFNRGTVGDSIRRYSISSSMYTSIFLKMLLYYRGKNTEEAPSREVGWQISRERERTQVNDNSSMPSQLSIAQTSSEEN